MTGLYLFTIRRAYGSGSNLTAAGSKATNEILFASTFVGLLMAAGVAAGKLPLALRDRLFQQQLLNAVFVEFTFRIGSLFRLAAIIAIIARALTRSLGLLALSNAHPSLGSLGRRQLIVCFVYGTTGQKCATAHRHDRKLPSFRHL